MDIEALLRITPGERTARLAEIKSEISKLESRIQVARSDANNDAGYERRKAEYEATILKWQKQLADLIYRKENSADIVEGCNDLIKQLKSEKIIHENAQDIMKVLKLQEKADATKSSD